MQKLISIALAGAVLSGCLSTKKIEAHSVQSLAEETAMYHSCETAKIIVHDERVKDRSPEARKAAARLYMPPGTTVRLATTPCANKDISAYRVSYDGPHSGQEFVFEPVYALHLTRAEVEADETIDCVVEYPGLQEPPAITDETGRVTHVSAVETCRRVAGVN